ncbi:hypothetical protein C9374_009692 [Naegleria lovaniensis]|uniref:Phosphoglucomutase n=1 Tax=Naegleria lovaniensis TaxID=51637 RepID=A0AA88KX80_NAELO|nr:uncharacterized protein C9374_009692 [Naegleria lovaniensis]KAG2393115.1 hypothetical protein C9374_009692 [Naegleria lovaniensis]
MSSNSVQQLAEQWLQLDPFDRTRAEIQSLLQQGNMTELDKRLTKRIEFGTAGLRSVMAAGFSCMNELIILQTSQGVCRYIEKETSSTSDRSKISIVIGYDGRHHSKQYAHLAAGVFLSRGFTVYLFKTMVCTPFVPFAVSNLNRKKKEGERCVAGIMVTASHNPKQDNGYKLYWENGCQIIPPQDEYISEQIMQNLNVWEEVGKQLKTHGTGADDEEVIDLSPWSELLKDPSSQADEYFEAIRAYNYGSGKPVISDEKIVYTAMHGVGTPFTNRAIEVYGLPKCIPVEEQIDADPEFTTVKYPNPEEGKGALKLAMDKCEQVGAILILANDPDADRLAVAEKQVDGTWRIFNGNEIAMLLADWVWTHYKLSHPNADYSKCVMIASTVSSKLLKAMAAHEGFKFDETLTGFKWIGNRADQYIKDGYTFLFGYEVEIGFLVGDCSLDKDGVRAASVFAEMAHYHYKNGKVKRLSEQIDNIYSKYGYFAMKTRYFFTPTTELLHRVMEDLRKIENGGYPTYIPSIKDSSRQFKIKSLRDLTKNFDSGQKDNKPLLPATPTSQMITFTFDNGATATIRNSGTEPKLKWYVETNDMNKEKAFELLDEMTPSILEYLLKPKENGLVAPQD